MRSRQAFRGRCAAMALATVLAWLIAGAARAHEYWLAPSRYFAEAGDTIAVSARVGTGFRGEARPWAGGRVLRFQARGTRALDLGRVAVEGDTVWARFVAADGGGTLVAYESNFARIELEAAKFDAYLEEEGLTAPQAARRRLGASAGPGRERYARCAKTWIAGSDAGRAASDTIRRRLAAVGLPLEIVPLGDPTVTTPLRVEVRFRGAPLAGARVRAWRQPLDASDRPRDASARDSLPPVVTTRTDARGIATIAAEEPGEWLIGTVHMVPSENRVEADWESRWASLGFARPR